MKPDSSTNAMVLPVRRAFLYAWPLDMAPHGDRAVIPLACLTLGVLARPLHALKQVPDPGRIEGLTEAALDHLADSLEGPQLPQEAERRWAAKQELCELLHLTVVQLARSTGMTLLFQPVLAALPPLLHPGGD